MNSTVKKISLFSAIAISQLSASALAYQRNFDSDFDSQELEFQKDDHSDDDPSNTLWWIPEILDFFATPANAPGTPILVTDCEFGCGPDDPDVDLANDIINIIEPTGVNMCSYVGGFPNIQDRPCLQMLLCIYSCYPFTLM